MRLKSSLCGPEIRKSTWSFYFIIIYLNTIYFPPYQETDIAVLIGNRTGAAPHLICNQERDCPLFYLGPLSDFVPKKRHVNKLLLVSQYHRTGESRVGECPAAKSLLLSHSRLAACRASRTDQKARRGTTWSGWGVAASLSPSASSCGSSWGSLKLQRCWRTRDSSGQQL